MEVSCGRPVRFFEAVSSDFFFFFGASLEERFTAPSVLHAVDRLGREAVVTTGSAHSRERLTFKGQAESAGRKQPFKRKEIHRRRIIKL